MLPRDFVHKVWDSTHSLDEDLHSAVLLNCSVMKSSLLLQWLRIAGLLFSQGKWGVRGPPYSAARLLLVALLPALPSLWAGRKPSLGLRPPPAALSCETQGSYIQLQEEHDTSNNAQCKYTPPPAPPSNSPMCRDGQTLRRGEVDRANARE